MAEASSYNRQIVSSSNWWVWIVIVAIIGVIIFVIYWVWHFFSRTTQVVKERVPAAVAAKESNIRFISTPTEVIVDDDPVIPEGETSIEAISKNFAAYQGQKVIVSGSVTGFQSPQYFSVKQGDYAVVVMDFSNVTVKNDLRNSSNPKSQFVRVSGTVKLLTKDKDKEEFGFNFRDFNDALWQDKIIIEATSIEVIPQSTT